eukprot:TRINITY_DN891_c5_g1_i1.p1 TRINITY_DN891_c5_g1~~TRINITY_DN891_c5_g1_i1.p1  ORF type:complete len:185 (-),score=73.67 TRINITY_DN891_c5_g1_i1:288-842(-)
MNEITDEYMDDVVSESLDDLLNRVVDDNNNNNNNNDNDDNVPEIKPKPKAKPPVVIDGEPTEEELLKLLSDYPKVRHSDYKVRFIKSEQVQQPKPSILNNDDNNNNKNDDNNDDNKKEITTSNVDFDMNDDFWLVFGQFLSKEINEQYVSSIQTEFKEYHDKYIQSLSLDDIKRLIVSFKEVKQ